MNTHHLELFYYVAKYQGVSNACRHIPYGVQQPAVSAQLIQLEEELGLKLFERKPFVLTDGGRLLFEFIQPFFGQLGDVKDTLTGKLAKRLRLAGPTQLMRDHLPALLQQMERKFPKLQLQLSEADSNQAQTLLERGEVDVAIVVQDGKTPSGIHMLKLASLPQLLLVPRESSWQNANDAIKAGAAGQLRLVSLPGRELLTRLFTGELQQRKLHWPVSIEVNSTDLVARYVSYGLGAGLVVASPLAVIPDNVRILELKRFPQLPVVALWKGKLPEVPAQFMEELKQRAKQFEGN
jgi:DNA-binding transcriptional LysR family regulator